VTEEGPDKQQGRSGEVDEESSNDYILISLIINKLNIHILTSQLNRPCQSSTRMRRTRHLMSSKTGRMISIRSS
jgi:hypothetical protein